jgi:hypothetical protein
MSTPLTRLYWGIVTATTLAVNYVIIKETFEYPMRSIWLGLDRIGDSIDRYHESIEQQHRHELVAATPVVIF